MEASSQAALELTRQRGAPGQAREAVGSFAGFLPAPKREAAVLLASELVTNAVKYGGRGPIELYLLGDRRRLRVEVVDQGDGFVPAHDAERGIGGWGLPIVEELSDRWGAFHGSTHVWFEIEA